MKNKLKELRKETGLNQTDFALKVGSPFQYISDMERGTKPVTWKTLEKYAKCFGWDYSHTLNCG